MVDADCSRNEARSVFDYLKDAVLVVDEPSAVDSYLGEVYQTLADRFAETDAADDIAVTPEELYLSAEELRAKLDQRQRVELRILGRAAAELDQEWRWMLKRLRFNSAATQRANAVVSFSCCRAGAGSRMENTVGSASITAGLLTWQRIWSTRTKTGQPRCS